MAISDWVLLPSLAVALVSGLVSMVVHRPFLDKGWVWIKAGLGILMFKGTLTIVSAIEVKAVRSRPKIAAVRSATSTMLAVNTTSPSR